MHEPSDTETFEAYRPLLFSIAYRMLGSAMEAEDMVQEAYLRFEGADTREVKNLKAFLTTIVTRLCLDHLKAAHSQREAYVGTWLPEPLPTQGSQGVLPELLNLERETLSMAFLVLLENLSPTQRAIFLLRDVFDYSYAEIAAMLGKSEANCRRYYHTAKQYLVERRSRYEPSSDEQRKLVDEFMLAMDTGDIDGLTHMLAEDCVLYGDGGGKAQAVRQPLEGREAVLRLIATISRMLPEHQGRLEVREVNGAPALLVWVGDRLYVVMNLDIENGQIKTVRNVLNPDKLTYLNQHSKPTDNPGASEQSR